MSVQGKWRVVETPDHDMAGPGAYILFGKTGGEFAFDCLTGSIHGACDGNTVEFSWTGNDEMEPASGDGWAELQEDGSLEGEISLHNGDDVLHRSPIDDFFSRLLVLLCHELRCLRGGFGRVQQGHRGALLTRATIRRRRRVAIELGM
jgi:hypothetical protein